MIIKNIDRELNDDDSEELNNFVNLAMNMKTVSFATAESSLTKAFDFEYVIIEMPGYYNKQEAEILELCYAQQNKDVLTGLSLEAMLNVDRRNLGMSGISMVIDEDGSMEQGV